MFKLFFKQHLVYVKVIFLANRFRIHIDILR